MSGNGEQKRPTRRGAGRSRARVSLEPEQGAGESADTIRSRFRGEAPREASPESPEEQGSPKSESPDREVDKVAERAQRLQLIELAVRPGFGKVGNKISIFANHFEIQLPQNLDVTHYHVEMSLGNLRLTRDDNRSIFWRCVKENPRVFGDLYGIVYDGDHICVSSKSLQFPTNHTEPGIFAFETKVFLTRFGRELIFNVRFQLVGPVSINTQEIRAATVGQSDRHITPLNVLDLLFRQRRSCPEIEISNAWYPFGPTVYQVPAGPDGMVSLGYGQEIWRGLFSSTRIGEEFKPFMNFDVSHSSFYVEQPVIDFMVEIFNKAFTHSGPFSIRQLNRESTLASPFVKELSKALKGVKVITEVQLESGGTLQRHFVVTGIWHKNALEDTFMRKSRDSDIEVEVTVAQHYRERYGELKYPSLPLLWVGGKKSTCHMPMERLRIMHKQRAGKKLLPEQTTIMIKTASVSSPFRADKIKQLMQASDFPQDQWLNTFGVRVNHDMKEVAARILNPPRIRYGAGPGLRGQGAVVNVRDGVWDNRGQKFMAPATLEKPGLIILDDRRDGELYSSFFKMLLGTCLEYGMRVPREINASDVHYISPLRGNDDLEPRLRELKDQGCKLVFVVVPEKGSPLYSETKRAAEIICGVMTQCVCKPTIRKTMEKNDRTVTANIALKVNTKMDGINWQVEADQPAKSILMEKPTLVLGVDVSHPAPFEMRAPSIAAIVGNLDDTFMKYAATIQVQKHRRESIIPMPDMVRERMFEYYKYRRDHSAGGGAELKPQRIIVFRDGVADGQFKEVIDSEVEGVRQACLQLEKNYRPSVTFIICQKRHHTRFFPRSKSESSGRGMNIFPGTVVDTGIVHPQQFEFYLCSHMGIQGTSRPVRYTILTDDDKFSADQLQSVAFYMTHNFARCARSVSLPAPLYYADLACRRARAHLYTQITDFSSDTLSTSSTSGADTSSTKVSLEEMIRGSAVDNEMKLTMYFV